jgi:hypothetical protein
LGVALILVGYFSPWVPHRTAGLALTGFEIGEWIKFAPEVLSGSSPLRRVDFYWPPAVAAMGLALLAGNSRPWHWRDWSLVVIAVILSLFPFPLLEEINDLNGIKANIGRLGLVAMGEMTCLVIIARHGLPARVRGAALLLAAGAGVILVSRAFSTAEPIVERLYDQAIDPGLGYNLTRSGMALLSMAGIIGLVKD